MWLLLKLFETRNAMWSLAPISVLAGIAALWVFGRASNQTAIRAAKNRLKASLYEMRLFGDEPALVWRAQKDLLAGNLRLIGLTLRPAVILLVPIGWLMVQMEPFYGRSPLPVGEAAIVTLQFKQPVEARVPAPVLQAPDGIAVETPGVRVMERQQVSWRIRPTRELSGNLRVVLPSETVEKAVVAGAGPRYVSDRRASGIGGTLWHPGESSFSSPTVDWIEIRYPSAGVRWLGLELNWILWFLIISMLAAIAARRRLGVSL